MRTTAAAFLLALTIGASPLALAQTTGTTTPPCVTQEQLNGLLKAQGYTDIKLSEVSPTSAQPRPDISCRTPESQAAVTATHKGWNGTAMKDGKLQNIYVDAAGRVSTRE
jgi:hypothetical protein